MKKVTITLTKSPLKKLPKHRRTIRALGLYKMHQSVEKEVTPAIQGMLNSVGYLIDVKEVK